MSTVDLSASDYGEFFDFCMGFFVYIMWSSCSGPDEQTEELLNIITNTRKMFMVPSRINGKFAIRYCVMYEYTEERHIVESWKTITEVASYLLATKGCTNGSLNGHP